MKKWDENTFPLQIVNLIHQTGALGGKSLTQHISLPSDVQTSAVKQIASLAFRRLCECYETRLKTSRAVTQPQPCCVYFGGLWYIKVQTSQSLSRENGWSGRARNSKSCMSVTEVISVEWCLCADMIHLMEQEDSQRTNRCQ